MEKEISEIDKKGNKENIEQKETKEEDKEKKIRKNPNLLHNIENNGINDDDKINVGIKNESKNEGANQLIIVDDDELVPSQSINEANIILNNNSKNSNNTIFINIEKNNKKYVGNNIDDIIRDELQKMDKK